MTEIGTACAVTCQVCAVQVWQGDIPPNDGQVLLTAYADSTPGTACPSKRPLCPNKTAARDAIAKGQAASLKDIEALQKRLDKLEAKMGKLP